jgi:chemotaxis protein methyltransferase WspC
MSLPTERITGILSKQLGLSGQSLGGKAIDSAIHRRMAAIKIDSVADYAGRLEQDRKELDELIEAVVVPETWFYRYPESFRHLGEYCNSLPFSDKPIRVLSAPCATGEECYSIAMALVEAGIPLTRFRVEGLDVSRRAIELAKRGCFGEHAFRESQVPPRERYFHSQKAEYTVRSEIRERVHFRTGNLADPNLLIGETPYDAVFCRNLFIYLTDQARQTVINTIDRLLNPAGVIYMGHAEPLTIMDQRFKSLPPPQAFAFSRAESQQQVMQGITTVPDSIGLSLTPGPANLSRPASSSSVTLSPVVTAQPKLPEPTARKSADLFMAAKLAANEGKIDEASQICVQLLDSAGPSAETYALLGTIRIMANDWPSAERNFTRALYLDPTHYDALLQMLTLAERRGDSLAVANYRRRLLNVDRKGST